MLHRLLFPSRNTSYVLLCSRHPDSADDLPTVIESPVFSGGGAQIGLLKLTVTLSVVDTEAAVQQAMDANAEMASAPIDPTAQLPSGLSDVADTARKLDFGSVLARLDGFMKVADLAAEVCTVLLGDASTIELPNLYFPCRSTHWSNWRGGLYQ